MLLDREGLRGCVDVGRVEDIGEFDDVVVAGSLDTASRMFSIRGFPLCSVPLDSRLNRQSSVEGISYGRVGINTATHRYIKGKRRYALTAVKAILLVRRLTSGLLKLQEDGAFNLPICARKGPLTRR